MNRTFNLSKETNARFNDAFKKEQERIKKLNYSMFADMIISEGLSIHDRIKE